MSLVIGSFDELGLKGVPWLDVVLVRVTSPDLGLHLNSSWTSSLIFDTDVDWGGCPNTRCSTSSYCFFR